MKAGIPVDQLNKKGAPAIDAAIEAGHVDTVREFVGFAPPLLSLVFFLSLPFSLLFLFVGTIRGEREPSTRREPASNLSRGV